MPSTSEAAQPGVGLERATSGEIRKGRDPQYLECETVEAFEPEWLRMGMENTRGPQGKPRTGHLIPCPGWISFIRTLFFP